MLFCLVFSPFFTQLSPPASLPPVIFRTASQSLSCSFCWEKVDQPTVLDDFFHIHIRFFAGLYCSRNPSHVLNCWSFRYLIASFASNSQVFSQNMPSKPHTELALTKPVKKRGGKMMAAPTPYLWRTLPAVTISHWLVTQPPAQFHKFGSQVFKTLLFLQV